MRQSQLFTRVRREAPKDEVSKNAALLMRAGYIHKEMAGVYSLLPLGLRVFKKIEQVIREEMNALGAQEALLSSLQDPEIWKTTSRWDGEVDAVWLKTKLANDTELGLAFTHEEPWTRIARDHVSSYRDLPFSTYHFAPKFRNELRAKSGLMRGREFVMKDLYSFSKTQEELDLFYDDARVAYENIFRRVGIGDVTYLTFASGGVFSKWSHEFQTVSEAGEDTIYIDTEKRIAVNKEVYSDEVLRDLGLNKDALIEATSIETGNIFKLGTKFSEPLGLSFKDESGNLQPVLMGSYGIGLGRLMATIVEVLSDEKGIVWPESVAPFTYHLVELAQGSEEIRTRAESLYEALTARGVSVLYDDRDMSAGAKFAESDLLGIPYRIVVGKNSTDDTFEVVRRATGETLSLARSELVGT